MDPSVQNAMMLQALQGQSGGGAPAQPDIAQIMQQAQMMQQMQNQPGQMAPPGAGMATQGAPQLAAPDPASMTGGLGSAQGMAAPQQGMPATGQTDPMMQALFSQPPQAGGM